MPDEPVDPLAYRRVVGRFATGVTVVTAYDGRLHHAMTVNSFTSVSLSPVLVLFCAEKIARLHDAVLGAKEWAVSVLGAGQDEMSRWFADRSRPEQGQLEGYAYTLGERTGAALFDDAIAHLECRTWASYEGGDHTVVVGEVLSVRAPESAAGPLLFYEGNYRQL